MKSFVLRACSVIERAEGVWVFDVEVTREEIDWALDRIRKVLI
jgi:DICT domain-containing protein